MTKHFNVLPKSIPSNLEPFTFHVPETDLAEFRELLKLSKIGPSTWWNQHDLQFGVSREWLTKAKDTWVNEFDWRQQEERINNFANFKIAIQDVEAGQIDIHFAAMFSTKQDAIPIILLHGFPSSFLEFLPMMQLLADKYTPETLPYHIIVPSLPDYGLSGGPTENVKMTLKQGARIMNQLMLDLGFGEGYVAQGGDLGSMLARIMSVEYKECKALHLNMLTLNTDETAPSPELLSSEESQQLQRTELWSKTGLAFALEHGTRPSTVGLAMSTNPLALLAWIGEKLCEWADPREPLPLDTILGLVSFYWFTNTFPRSLYHAEVLQTIFQGKPLPITKVKPLGYTLFPGDLCLLPHGWAKQLYPNLVFFRSQPLGGHFGRMEQPKDFLEDVEDFVNTIRESFKNE
ncbi:Alpha/Beta hydrolase protein [Xylariales sp. PMI_506]|nr:Alpha/Beta hydrolase protein [Xylariales sp. PMI_506]